MIFMFVNSMIENLKFLEKNNSKKIYIKNLLTKEMADVIVFLEKGNVVYE